MADKKPLKRESGKTKQFDSTDTVPTANLGTGTANSGSALFGDQTYKTIPTLGLSIAIKQSNFIN